MTGSAAGPGPGWNILCDFDGTVTPDDVVDGLLERFGQPGWQGLEQQWRANLIGSRECMQRQVALLDVSLEELDHYLDAVQIDPDFQHFVAAARSLGYALSIISDGIDYAIRRILNRHDLSGLPVAANHLMPGATSRRWQLTSPFEAPDCLSGTCKCARIANARSHSGRRVLLIGDGRSDFCASGAADLIFAKPGLIEHCRRSGAAYLPVEGFRTALGLLPRLGSLVPGRAYRARSSAPVSTPRMTADEC